MNISCKHELNNSIINILLNIYKHLLNLLHTIPQSSFNNQLANIVPSLFFEYNY